MEFTGERFVPDEHGDVELEHRHRYLQACEIAQGLTVLDIASGEGYGSAMLAEKAAHVTGVDISEKAVTHARTKYQKANLEYKAGNCAAIPMPDASVDLVVSFETIEHHDQHEEMMREIKRVLRPGGVLLISSPDRYNYSVVPNYDNPYHVKELTGDEFKQLLGKYFKNATFFGQRVMYGSGIFPESAAAPAHNYSIGDNGFEHGAGMLRPLYWIALASDGELPQMASGVFDQPVQEAQAVKAYHAHLVRQCNELNAKLNMVLASSSWRITKPLRFARRQATALFARRAPFLLRPMWWVLSKLSPRRRAQSLAPAYRPVAPQWKQFETLTEEKRQTQSPLVDVIVPVYRGYDDTFACLLSVLKSINQTPFELVVLDDCSPEPRISADLERLANMNLITLVKNKTNLGFVGTVNRGMALHADRDVILLNSDTVVFNDWIDRLRAHAKDNVATVTPFTSNGTICSYPKFCENNPQELEIGFERLDQLAAAANQGQSVDVPSAVGFCMYIVRRALDEAGNFDEATFGKGYGEENDFCMRVYHKGWRNIHALDTYVFHSGEISFADTASEYKRRAYDLLLRKHPDYDGMVHSFLGKDPARPARLALDVARVIGRPLRPAVLYIAHAWGGGLQRYIEDRAQEFYSSHRDMLVVVPLAPGSTVAQLVVPNTIGQLGETAQFDFSDPPERLKPLFDALKVQSIELQTTAGWSSEMISILPKLSQAFGIPYNFMLHDYQVMCPQIHLVNETGLYCGEKGPEQCNKCLSSDKSMMYLVHADLMDKKAMNIQRWRTMHMPLLKEAAQILAPSVDAAERIKKYFDVDVKVVPHDEAFPSLIKSPRQWRHGERLKVGVIGKIATHKGLAVLLRCAEDARKRNLPIEFTVFGSTDKDLAARKENIAITGAYLESEIYNLLAARQTHMIFLPSVWPETYSYTLSIAMAAGLPTAVFDIGAQADRLREEGSGLILPLDTAQNPGLINDELIRFMHNLIPQSLVA